MQICVNILTWGEILFCGQKQTVASLTMVLTCLTSQGTLRCYDCGCRLLPFLCLAHPAWPLFRHTLWALASILSQTFPFFPSLFYRLEGGGPEAEGLEGKISEPWSADLGHETTSWLPKMAGLACVLVAGLDSLCLWRVRTGPVVCSWDLAVTHGQFILTASAAVCMENNSSHVHGKSTSRAHQMETFALLTDGGRQTGGRTYFPVILE